MAPCSFLVQDPSPPTSPPPPSLCPANKRYNPGDLTGDLTGTGDLMPLCDRRGVQTSTEIAHSSSFKSGLSVTPSPAVDGVKSNVRQDSLGRSQLASEGLPAGLRLPHHTPGRGGGDEWSGGMVAHPDAHSHSAHETRLKRQKGILECLEKVAPFTRPPQCHPLSNSSRTCIPRPSINLSAPISTHSPRRPHQPTQNINETLGVCVKPQVVSGVSRSFLGALRGLLGPSVSVFGGPRSMSGVPRSVLRLPRSVLVLLVLVLPLLTLTQPTLAQVMGDDIRCHGEGVPQPVPPEVVKDNPCIGCSCQDGRVMCRKKECPKLEGCYWKLQTALGECCQVCKGCVHHGAEYPHGARWSEGCVNYQCQAGVLTVSQEQCHLPCVQPMPAQDGTCCQTCPRCWLEGRRVGEGEVVSSRADPCVQCRCVGGRLTCHKRACPVLSCPPSSQVPAPGGCCMTCRGSRELISPPGGRCFLNSFLYRTGMEKELDPCTTCVCHDGFLTCHSTSCPILNCSHHYQVTREGECCPTCSAPVHPELESSCVVHGLTHLPGDKWKLDQCTTCGCESGTVHCEIEPCEYINRPCPAGLKRIESESECCPRCEKPPGTCVVFGDPHYRTFDGLLYTFQGACRYTLAEECGHKNNFSLRVSNDAPRPLTHSNALARNPSYARTRSLTLKLPGVKVKMCQKLRIKVNGKMVQPPYTHPGVFNLTRIGQALSLTTPKGVGVVWDGWSYTEVQVPVWMEGRMCGLCGNYNGNATDDLTTRKGRLVKSADRMAASWSTGRARQCRRRVIGRESIVSTNHEQSLDASLSSSAGSPARPRAARSCRTSHSRTVEQCGLLNATVFHACHSHVPVDMFYESCIKGMCECGVRRCECDTILAYARQCQHLGISVDGWRHTSKCGGLECPRGAEFMTCAPPCRATCRNPTPNPRCHMRKCRAGCYCPPPSVLHRGACIPPEKCRKRRRRNRRRNY